jgi:hypothetical protein
MTGSERLTGVGTPLYPLGKQGNWILVAAACDLTPTWAWSWTAGEGRGHAKAWVYDRLAAATRARSLQRMGRQSRRPCRTGVQWWRFRLAALNYEIGLNQ